MQYLVTARHVLEGIKTGEFINIWHEKQWKPIGVNVIGVGEGDVDVIVLAFGEQVSPTHPLKADGAGLIIRTASLLPRVPVRSGQWRPRDQSWPTHTVREVRGHQRGQLRQPKQDLCRCARE